MTDLTLRTAPTDPNQDTYQQLLQLKADSRYHGALVVPDGRKLQLRATGTKGTVEDLQVVIELGLDALWSTYREDDSSYCVEVYGRVLEVVNGDPRLHDAIDVLPFAAGTFSHEPDRPDSLSLYPTELTAQREFMKSGTQNVRASR